MAAWLLSILQERGTLSNRKLRGTFCKAREYQVPFTIHAGEAGNAEDVKTAVHMGQSGSVMV